MQQRKRYTFLKNLKNLDVKNLKKKSCKIIILRAKYFNLYYFLFYFRSIDTKIKELEAKNLRIKQFDCINRKAVTILCPHSLHPTLQLAVS